LVEIGMERAASLLDVAQHFFSAALTPADWAPALDATVGLLRAEHAIIVVHEPLTGRAVLTKSAGMDDAHFARYLSPEATTWMAPFIEAMPSGTVVRAPPELMPDRHFARTELYNEVVRPANGFYAVALQHELPALSVFMAACRPRSAGNFEADDAAALQALLPHLATSLQLHHRLQATQERHDAVTTVLDRLADGVILTDAVARPTFVNARAAQIVGEADGLAMEAEPLSAATPAATHRLREAIAVVAADAANEGLRLRLDRPSRRRPLLLTVLPIWRLGAPLPGARAPRVAIFIKELDAPVAINQPAVVKAFHLTPRECEIATLLAAGHDLTEIAAAMRVARSTVRSHLVHIFAKTGARSQAALVAALSRFIEPQR
jgi:DNA-binding CsgD family transcriptional regulator